MQEEGQVSADTLNLKLVKLTDWAKEPTVMALKGDLEAAKPSHDLHVAKINRWNDLRNVTGSARPKTQKNRSNVQPKLVRKQAEWRYPALSEPFLSAEKIMQIKPKTFEDVKAAQQNELLLNWQLTTKINKVKFIDSYVRTTVDEGTCIVRLGWERLTRPVKKEVPVYQYLELTDPEMMQELQDALAFREANFREYSETVPEEIQAAVDYFLETGIPTFVQVTGTEVVTEDEIYVNRPTLDILNYENVTIDPSCQGDIDKAKFAVISFETSQAELKADGRYKNLEAINWEGATVLAQPDHATQTAGSFNFSDKARKRIVAYEYWGFVDVEGNGVLTPIVATWVGDTMIRLERNPFPDEKIPLVLVPYLPVKRALEGEPDAEVLEDNQKILGAVTRGVIDLMGRSANAQQGFAKGFLDPINRRRYDSGQDYEFNPGNGDPRMSVYQHMYPEIPNSALTVMGLQNQEAESLTGVKAFAGGMSGEAYGEVAAGIRGMLDAASKREMSILRRLVQGMIEISRKIIAMNAVFLTEEEVVRLTNEKFVSIRREDLKGEFDFECDIITPEVAQAQAQDLGFMLQTIGPDMEPGLRSIVLAKIARLKRMPDLAKSLEEYQPQPDPLAEELKRLEIAKLQKEVEELDSKIALNMAKARSEGSKADRTDLDYVEQESGTKHERDMQKLGAQASSNEKLEVTKALLKPQKAEEVEPNIDAAIGYQRMVDNGLM